jgi:hypothetical protein
MFGIPSASVVLLFAVPRAALLVPLAMVCLATVAGLCVAASKSFLHIPAYVGLAFFSFAAAMVVGHYSGAANISGTPTGLALSVLFFLLIATAVGSVLALFFYRHPYV